MYLAHTIVYQKNKKTNKKIRKNIIVKISVFLIIRRIIKLNKTFHSKSFYYHQYGDYQSWSLADPGQILNG